MKSRHFLCTLLVAVAATTTASATTVTFTLGGTNCGTAGVCTSVANAQQIDFDSATAPSPHTSGPAVFSFSPGGISPFVIGSVVNEYETPPSDGTRYLAAGALGRAGSVTIDFVAPILYYGMYVGSPDPYNLIQFFETGNNVTPVASFTGDMFNPQGRLIVTLGEYVNFSVSGGDISRIVLSSSAAALESDNHAYLLAPPKQPAEAPEPATMGLMAGALLGLGLYARRRRV
jgi:hypothetical protein